MTLLPLETFRQQLGWNPYFFWGLSNPQYMPVKTACPAVIMEYGWQNSDAAGRAEIRNAVESAERLIQNYLGYAIAPQYAALTMPWPRFANNAEWRIGTWDATGRYIAPRLPFGFGQVQAIGTELLTLVGTATVGGGTLVFSNEYNGANLPLDDTFTITLPTTETDPDKLAVYFVAADRPDGEPVGDRYRVLPVSVSIAAGVATIVGRIWLIVRPPLYEAANLQPLDPADTTSAGPYAQSLVVYTRTTDPTGTTWETAQATLIWETSPVHGWWCGCGCQNASVYAPGDSRDPGASGYGVGRAVIRDAKMGVIGIDGALYNATSGVWQAIPWADCHEPDSVTVRVLAGQPLENGNVAGQFQRMTARLAIAELGRPVCACDQANRDLYHWQFDVSRSQGADETFGFVSREDLNNPLGTRRGAIWAWKQIRNMRLTPGVVGF